MMVANETSPLLSSALQRTPFVAILRGIGPLEVVAVGQVLVDAGFTAIEVPLNSPDALESIRLLRQTFGNRLIVGAGTVLEPKMVSAVYDAGGTLIVSPNFDPFVIARTKALGMMSMPGCYTPSECFNALASGADVLKIFPANVLGASYCRALKTVLPEYAKLLPTGGVNTNNVAAYLNAGVVGVGLGESLYKVNRPLHTIQSVAAAFMNELKQVHG